MGEPLETDSDFLPTLKQGAQDQCVQAFSRVARMNIGNLVVKVTSMETAVGVIRLIDLSVTTPYFVEWLSGFMCGYTTAHPLDHIEQWSKNDR